MMAMVRCRQGLELVARLIHQRSAERVTVIAVDGHSAAGKLTFARLLTERVDATILPGDAFYRVMDEDVRARLTPSEGVDSYYDWERMRTEALTILQSGCPATFGPYDWDRNIFAECAVTVEPKPVVGTRPHRPFATCRARYGRPRPLLTHPGARSYQPR